MFNNTQLEVDLKSVREFLSLFANNCNNIIKDLTREIIDFTKTKARRTSVKLNYTFILKNYKLRVSERVA